MENKKKPVDRRYSETYYENHEDFEDDDTYSRVTLKVEADVPSTDQPRKLEILSKKNKKLNCAIGMFVAILSLSVGVNIFFILTKACSEDDRIIDYVNVTTDNDVGCVPVIDVQETGHPSAYVIGSSGEAKDQLPTYMGMYKLTNVMFTSKPVYKHETEEKYLYYNSNNHWVAHNKLHVTSSYFYAPKPSNADLPPQTGWKYWNIPTSKSDSSLTVQQIEGSAYNISSSGGARDEFPQFMGVYTVTKDVYNDKPVYKKESTDAYLFMDSNDNWVVYKKLHNSYAKLYTSLSENSDSPPTSGWKYNPSAYWLSDPSLTVTQIKI